MKVTDEDRPDRDYVTEALRLAHEHLEAIVPEDEFEGIGNPDSDYHYLRQARERCAEAIPISVAQWNLIQAARMPTSMDHTGADGNLWHARLGLAFDDLEDAMEEDSASAVILRMERG